jgi:hypothetical protein
MFHGITPAELRRTAFEFTDENNVPNDFNPNTKKSRKILDQWISLVKLDFASQKLPTYAEQIDSTKQLRKKYPRIWKI